MMTLTFATDLDIVKMNQRAKLVSFSSTVIEEQTHTQTPSGRLLYLYHWSDQR